MAKISSTLRGAALIFIAATAASSQAANLLQNSGFEAGNISGWASVGAFVTGAEAHTGSFSVSSFGSDYVSRTFAAIATSDISELSFWGKNTNGFDAAVYLSYSGSIGFDSPAVAMYHDQFDWTKIDLTNVLVSGKSLTGFKIVTSGLPGAPGYIDDFTLTTVTPPVPEPSSYALLMAGLVAIGTGRINAKRRRSS